MPHPPFVSTRGVPGLGRSLKESSSIRRFGLLTLRRLALRRLLTLRRLPLLGLPLRRLALSRRLLTLCRRLLALLGRLLALRWRSTLLLPGRWNLLSGPARAISTHPLDLADIGCAPGANSGRGIFFFLKVTEANANTEGVRAPRSTSDHMSGFSVVPMHGIEIGQLRIRRCVGVFDPLGHVARHVVQPPAAGRI